MVMKVSFWKIILRMEWREKVFYFCILYSSILFELLKNHVDIKKLT